MTVLVAGAQLATDADDFRLAGSQVMLHIAVVVAAMRLIHQHVHPLTQHLLSFVAENLRCGLVKGFHEASIIDYDDRVHGGGQYCPELIAGRWLHARS